jgi:hypothetical protein
LFAVLNNCKNNIVFTTLETIYLNTKNKKMKNLKKLTLAILFTTVFANVINAQAIAVVAKTNPTDFTVKFTGVNDGYLCFSAFLPTTQNAKSIKVVDAEEGELYTELVNANINTVQFRIEKRAGQELTFKFYDGKNVSTKTFTANVKITESISVEENSIASL